MNDSAVVNFFHAEEITMQFWQSRPRESISKIVAQQPLGIHQAFYDPRSNRFYSSNPDKQFINVAILVHLLEAKSKASKKRMSTLMRDLKTSRGISQVSAKGKAA